MRVRTKSLLVRGVLSGLAGGVAWMLALTVVFTPAQLLLADPDLQSAKMLSAFAAEPLPRTAAQPLILPAGLLVIGAVWGLVYAHLAQGWTVAWWKRGLRFALVAWALMALWFEFYLPWNVLLEPAPLVLLELACWACVIACVGLAIAGVDAALRPRA